MAEGRMEEGLMDMVDALMEGAIEGDIDDLSL